MEQRQEGEEHVKHVVPQRINTTPDSLLALKKKSHTANTVHLSASVRSDDSTTWLEVHMKQSNFE